METRRKSCLKGAAGEQMPNFLTKQEMEWLAEDSHTLGWANYEVGEGMESIRSIKTEEDPHYTDAEAHAVQEFTPVPQTEEFIKVELVLDEEFRDKMRDSEANSKELVLAQAKVSNSDKDACGFSFTQNTSLEVHKHTKPLATALSITSFECSRAFKRQDHLKRHLSTHSKDGKKAFPCDLCERTFSSISNLKRHKDAHTRQLSAEYKTFICEVCNFRFTEKGSLKRHMLTKHLDKVQLNAPGPQTADDDAIDSDMEEFLDEEPASYGQAIQLNAAQSNEITADKKSEACVVCHCIYPTEYMRTHVRLEHSFKRKYFKRQREATYECEICSRAFKRQDHLKRHLSTHSKDGKKAFPCDLCERTFFSIANLKRHKENHPRQMSAEHKTFICEVCNFRFTEKGNLKRHMLTKHLDKVQLNPQTADNDAIDSDMEEFLDEEPASYGQAIQLNATQSNEITADKKSEACEVCHCIYPTEYMRTHVRLEHSFKRKYFKRQREATYECEICSRSFENKYPLQRHLSTHSKDRRRDFACDLCDRTFYEERVLWAHKKVHTQETYHCKVCNQGFKHEKSLKAHMLRRQHFDETQQFTGQPSNDAGMPMKTELKSDEEEEFIDEGKYRAAVSHAEGSLQTALPADEEQGVSGGTSKGSVTCEVCNKSCPAELIETHMRITHNDRAYKCQFCPRIFLIKKRLEKHIITHDDDRIRPYGCEQCDHKFTAKSSLLRHMATQHTKHRMPEFNCELCERKFFSKSGLAHHMKTHTEETVGCETCGARFIQEDSLRKHMARKHASKT